MMPPTPERQPIPPEIWERIVEFSRAGKYGRIELDFRDGDVVAARIIESIQKPRAACTTESAA